MLPIPDYRAEPDCPDAAFTYSLSMVDGTPAPFLVKVETDEDGDYFLSLFSNDGLIGNQEFEYRITATEVGTESFATNKEAIFTVETEFIIVEEPEPEPELEPEPVP